MNCLLFLNDSPHQNAASWRALRRFSLFSLSSLPGNFKTLFKRVLIYLRYGWAIRSSGAKIKIRDLTHLVGCCVFALDEDKLSEFFLGAFSLETVEQILQFSFQ